ncbi:MAG TPA: Crp/Fnr family transcriptional regulator [Trueperaceae bacterium]
MVFTNAEILSRCPLFAELNPGDLQALARVAAHRHYAAGQTLFLENSPPEGLHVVIRGRVNVYVLSPESGREIILTVEHPYSAVAELPSLDGGNYPANAEAAEDTETLFLEQEAFLGVLRNRPEISLHLVRTLGRRLRRLVALIEQLSFQEVIHRLAGYLLERAANGLPFELETNASIAAQLGTVPELISRNLSRLQHSGAIALTNRRVEAVDHPTLHGMAASAGR